MLAAAEDFEAHGQLVGSNCRFLLAWFVGGFKRGGWRSTLPLDYHEL